MSDTDPQAPPPVENPPVANAPGSPEPATPPAPPEGPPRISARDRMAAKREAYKPGNKPPVIDREEIAPAPPRLRDLDAQIEAELQAAMEGMSDKDLYAEPKAPARPTLKDGPKPLQTGKVISVHNADVFIDLPGGRSQGVLPMTQFPEGAPAVGSTVEFQIERYDPANGLLILTRKGAAVATDWSSVEIGQTVEARVTETNKGGLSVEVNGIRGFLPISQIDLYRVENPEQYVNQKLLCLVAEVNPEEKNLVVSRRALLEREREEQSKKLWEELNEGQIRRGTVRSVKPFGAFVDLGGVDGLIPVGELSWQRVGDPSEVVKLGQAVQVVVTKLDREHKKVGLSLRQLLTSPWEEIQTKYPPGTNATGKVSRVADFGAFVELEPGIEGLIHISELGTQRVRRVKDIVQEGQTVEVRVLNVDREQRRMSLSLKAIQQEENRKKADAADAVKSAEEAAKEAEEEAKAAEKAKRAKPRTTPLKGGTGSGGPLFPTLGSGSPSDAGT
jgi:small subunit ribosomal protein S1